MGEIPPQLVGKTFADNPDNINRTGLNKGCEHSKTRLIKMLSLYIKSKNELLNSEEEEQMTVLEKMDMMQMVKAIKGDTKAYKEIMDRLEGKAVETIKQTIVDTDKKINISFDGKDIDLSK